MEEGGVKVITNYCFWRKHALGRLQAGNWSFLGVPDSTKFKVVGMGLLTSILDSEEHRYTRHGRR